MKTNLKSALWPQVCELIRKCHLSQLTPEGVPTLEWLEAFEELLKAIKDERKINSVYFVELSDLTSETGFDYDFSDILEEYFDHLEEQEEWDKVIESANELLNAFVWKKTPVSEYYYRIGNALMNANRLSEALEFGTNWLREYPNDYYAAASNVFLLVKMKKYEEAQAITEKYLGADLVCNDKNDTFFMAAYRLFEMTDNSYAKERVAKKIAEYNREVE